MGEKWAERQFARVVLVGVKVHITSVLIVVVECVGVKKWWVFARVKEK